MLFVPFSGELHPKSILKITFILFKKQRWLKKDVFALPKAFGTEGDWFDSRHNHKFLF
jgi:hypothetical protein